jgi:mannose-6-phosphate isomerase
MSVTAYPLLLQPVYKDYIWGGNRLSLVYNRENTPHICAESWEVSDRPEGMSVVVNGFYKGKTLHDLVQIMGSDLIGKDISSDVFPLLVKIIDAKKDLSVQVHPNDGNAGLTGGEAKTEMWYVLAADSKSVIYAGLKPGVTRKSFEKSLAENSLESVALAKVPAVAGRAVYVPGGRVHAIGAGCLLLEVQQNSNTTYRVYDWRRKGIDGKPRELHLEKALQVIDWDNSAPEVVPPSPLDSIGENRHWQIMDSPFFRIRRMELSDAEEVSHDGSSFQILFVVSGSVLIGANSVVASTDAGTSCLIPATVKNYTVTPIKGSASLIQITM